MSSPSGRTYVIRSIRDLFEIPADRLPVCLMELEAWVRHAKADMLVHGLPQSLGPFLWTDDGTAGITTERRVLERPALRIGHGYLKGNVNDTAERFRDMSVREQHARQA